MTRDYVSLPAKITLGSLLLWVLLARVALIGRAVGSTGVNIETVFHNIVDPATRQGPLGDIIWHIRLPRTIMAALVGATLALGGLVFQALLRNPLAEPYILGISGGSAIGAIIGILMGLSRFPGVWLTAFVGSMGTLALLLFITGGRAFWRADSLLLSGVMVNAFCSAVIMFLVSMAQDARLHNIIFWLMGDFSAATLAQTGGLALTVMPCFVFILMRAHALNLISADADMARTLGLNVRLETIALLVVTSLMVSTTVSHSGLLGFVGLVTPHLLRLLLGPDHRLLVPASVLGGSSFMIACDIVARTLPQQGEIPVGVITAMVGVPLFIVLLRRTKT